MASHWDKTKAGKMGDCSVALWDVNSAPRLAETLAESMVYQRVDSMAAHSAEHSAEH